jgi:hypothetical protein
LIDSVRGKIEFRLAFRPESEEYLLRESDDLAFLNVAALQALEHKTIRKAVVLAIRDATDLAEKLDRSLIANHSFEHLNDEIIDHLADDRFGIESTNRMKEVLASFVGATRQLEILRFLASRREAPNLEKHNAILRYGIVELRVIENYLRDPERLFSTMEELVRNPPNEEQMYKRGNPANAFDADDFEWNIRALMTNAGFYPGDMPQTGRAVLADWCQRYSTALQENSLSTCAIACPAYLTIQREYWETSGTLPHYVRHPSTLEIYKLLEGHNVLFLSPLADAVNEQVRSGRVRHLYKDYRMPEFNLEAIPAWISTWPNRPHGDWSETFGRTCDAIDVAYRARPFDVFMSSCGCYGLPVSDHVRKTYGAKVIYLGNIANAYFGVVQQGTKGFVNDRTNPEMWIEGNLANVPNIARIDGGRYV